MKPRIGMLIRMKSADDHYVIGQSDINAVRNAGGLPVLIPVADSTEDIAEQLENIDALYIPGGPDINTLLFGEEPIQSMGGSRRSDDIFETEAVRRAAEKKLPILGICRGEQIINVALGGTVYQDIPAQYPNALRHRQPDPGREMTHSVKVEKGTQLYSLCQSERIEVNTFHHQSVKELGRGMKVSATAPDGIIEAIESGDGRIIGVQWHPELLQKEGGIHTAVFKRLVELAGNK